MSIPLRLQSLTAPEIASILDELIEEMKDNVVFGNTDMESMLISKGKVRGALDVKARFQSIFDETDSL